MEFGTAGEFTFATETAGGTPDESVVKYEYAFNAPNPTTNPALATTKGALVKKTLSPPAAGVNVLFVWAVDNAGNRSAAPMKYIFYVKPRKGRTGMPGPPARVSTISDRCYGVTLNSIRLPGCSVTVQRRFGEPGQTE